MTEARDLTALLRDGAYTAVGFGVVALQKAMVQRAELRKRLEAGARDAREQVRRVAEELAALR
ncbi:MAG: hypothetical protein AVDCRST_MAG50-2149 [uncultured Acidimicrobiales bacterium]|uniref:Uncharacterized protein n=1 Tax=uncultured Acidimicrobiales bacterium TaxID=310071 RepID=A0A6J4I1J8_9ACTN|nr:MAG: hypothetical protein AVDCRST_MAG50-2149 [uncultured Acidimicrobiales bacterium]